MYVCIAVAFHMLNLWLAVISVSARLCIIGPKETICGIPYLYDALKIQSYFQSFFCSSSLVPLKAFAHGQ